MLDRLGIKDRRELVVLACLIALVAITPLGNEGTHPVVLFVYRTLLLGIVAAFAAWTDRAKLRRLCPYFVGTVITIIGLMILSVIRWPGSCFEGFYSVYTNALFMAAFIALAHGGAPRPTGWKYGILACVVVIDVAYLAAALAGASTIVKGPFVNPNYLASFLLPGIAICTAVVSWARSWGHRIAAAIAGLFLFYGIGQTSSRGATLSALGLLGIAGFRAARKRGISWIRIGAVASLLVVATIAINPALVRKFLDRGQRDPYNYQRTQIWLGTLSMIADYPATGVGPGHFYYMAKRFTPAVDGTVAKRSRWPNIAHSEYLQYIAEIGLPGGILLFGTAAYLLFLAWKRAAGASPEASLLQEAAILTAAGLGIHGMVDNNWTVPVMASGLAVISQADLLPYRDGVRLRFRSPLWRNALAMLFLFVWFESALVSSVGLYFNEAGFEAYSADDFTRAETSHRLALAVLPTHPVLLDNLGTTYFSRYLKTRNPELLDHAEIFFSESMRQNPNFDAPVGHMEKVLIERLTGDPRHDNPTHKRIVDNTRRGLEINPFNPFIRKNLAEGLYNLGDRQQACAELRTAIRFEPNYVPGYLRLAEWYEQMGQVEKSNEYREQAVRIANIYKDKQFPDDFENLLLGRPKPVRP